MSLINFKKRIVNNLFTDNICCKTRTKTYTYRDLLILTSKFAYLLETERCTRVMIDLKQGASSYALIIASFLCGVEFCVINRQWSSQQKFNSIESYRPSIIVTDEIEIINYNQNDIKMFADKNIDDIVLPDGYNIANHIRNSRSIYTLFTSGTTGMPKGVRIKATAVTNLVEWAVKKFAIDKKDVWGQYANIYFDMSMFDIFGSFYVGCTIVPFSDVIDKLKPGILIKDLGITFLNAVPQVINILETARELNYEYLKSLRKIKFGGDKITVKQVEKLLNILPALKFILTYGPTETTIFASYLMFDYSNYKTFAKDIFCLGKPVKGCKIILDEKDSEIIIAGSNLALGYIDSHDTMFSSKNINGVNTKIYRTGDFAEQIDGELYFRGRMDNQIKIRGIRTTTYELEHSLLQNGFSKFEIIISSNKIFVVYEDDIVDINSVRVKMRDVPKYLLPAKFIKIKKLPITCNGKIDVNSLKRLVDLYENEKALNL